MTTGQFCHPLSPGQESLWLLHQLGEPHPSYTLPFGVRLQGELDVAALARACQAVVARHAPLHSRVTVQDGAANLEVLDRPPEDVAVLRGHDLAPASEGDLHARLDALYEQACREPFHLGRGPLIRFDLIHESERHWSLVAVAHHIVFDGTSKAIFARELAHCYAAFLVGAEPKLPAFTSSYADYAREERSRLPDLLVQLRSELDNLRALHPGPLVLPFDHPRPPKLSGTGSWLSFTLAGPLRSRLEALASLHEATMFQVLLAALVALLYRYGNMQVTLTVGMGTRPPTAKDLIGYFVNNVPIGLDVEDDPTFVTLLGRARDQARQAARRRHVPLAQLVELLNPPRQTGVQPLFQVGLFYQGDSAQAAALPGLQTDWQRFLPNFGAKCDLLLQVLDREASVDARFEYSTELFDAPTIDRLLGHFHAVLHAAATDPDQPLSCIPLLGEAEREQLVGWNATAAASPAQRCVHELFEAQAARTPEAPAVVFGDESLTYAELDRRANQFARHLENCGVRPEVLVGVCLERGLDLLVGLLGILKAGGAYLPLDPDHPPERLVFMVDEAAPGVVVTQQRFLNRLPEHADLVCIDTDWPVIASKGQGALDRKASPTNLAYVIYTSGSTGRPKGVMIEHQSLTNLVCSMCHEPGFAADDTVLAVTSLSFDIAALELFGPLVVGARVVLTRGGSFLDGRALAEALRASNATIMQATPVTWRLLLDAGWRAGRGIKALCGGEALTRELAVRLLATGVSLWNLYGPTETTIWSSLARVDERQPTDRNRHGTVPIGRPIANTAMYVLDGTLNPLPVGVSGELYIGGAGLARGYLHDPTLTADRFVPHHLCGRPDARLYRTGDLARYRPDGTVEYLGRSDQQVKLRGMRIEPGEVEAALLAHPAVRQAVVALRAHGGEEARLVAYLVPTGEARATPEDLRSFLRRSLPAAMVPTSFVTLEAFPLTPNGKLDKNSLLAPAHPGQDLAVGGEPPRTRLEAQLAGMWAALLGLEHVGVHDDFFDLGGNSLAAIKVIARVQDVYGMELPLRVIFDAPTVAGLASVIQSTEAGKRPPQPG